MAKKKKSNTPRHKRLKREGRLQAARHWIPKYEGKNIIKGYSKHFAVDKLCAVIELQILGYKIDPEYIKSLKATLEGERRANERSRELELEKKLLESYLESDSDDTFYYIAGYTAGGAPYGITWDEYEGKNTIKDDTSHKNEGRFIFEDDDIPF